MVIYYREDNSTYLHKCAHAVIGTNPQNFAVPTVQDRQRRARHPLPFVDAGPVAEIND